jgi:hypothetical protein
MIPWMTKSGAAISDCRQYRYRLWRQWNDALPSMAFIMLNPSTADDQQDDATVRKCIGFAHRHGAGGIEIVNLFAFRSRDPRVLAANGFPTGNPENDQYVRAVTLASGAVVCAWGAHARGLPRCREMILQLRGWGCVPYALALTKDCVPRHPLMLSYHDDRGALRPLVRL